MNDLRLHALSCGIHTMRAICTCGVEILTPVLPEAPKPIPVVVPFTGGNVQDIPRGLRALADELEASGTRTLGWVTIDEDGTVQVGILGVCHDTTHAMGILHRGLRTWES